MLRTSIAFVGAMLCAAASASATPSSSSPLSLEEAIQFALRHHPALQTQAALEASSTAQVELAKTLNLPRLDASAEFNRATGNVLTGSLFPLPGIPTVSGPPSASRFDGGAFGTVVGVSVAWNVFSLKQQMTAVDSSLFELQRVKAATDGKRLWVAYGAADAFINLVAAGEAVSAAQANVERARQLAIRVKALVAQELRPGAEGSRADAELAIAQTQLARAEQAEAVSRTELARALGVAGQEVHVTPGSLLSRPPEAAAPSKVSTGNPYLAEAALAKEAATARTTLEEVAYLPRLDVVGALWIRGSGIPSAGETAILDGAVPNVPNWAAGVVLSWPILDLYAIRARVHAAQATVTVASSRQAELSQEIQSQIDRAKQVLDGARKVAANTPLALAAARDAERQAMARFESGLANVVEVAEAQRLLAHAEADDAVARLGVRSAELLLARAIGDLSPFLAELHDHKEAK